MKTKPLVALLAAATTIGVPLAAAAPQKGKPPTTGPACKPAVTVVVRGTAAADGGASSLSLTVNGGNHWAKLLFASNANTATTVNTTSGTPVQVSGKTGALTSVKQGDRMLVQYRTCKADLQGTNSSSAGALSSFLASLSAKRVLDLGSKGDNESEND